MTGGVMTGGTVVKVAVAEWLALIVSVHAPVPVQSPLQPVNVEPEAAVAGSVTVVADAYDAEQVAPQLIPAGARATEPEPLPLFVTVSVWLPVSKVAVTLRAWLIVTTHVPVP